MAFRRKCDDELVPDKIQIPYARGPIGPVRVYLMGLAGRSPERPIAFTEEDPDGAAWLENARRRCEQAIESRKALPQTERIDASALIDRDGNWDLEEPSS